MVRFCTKCVISDARPSSVVVWQRKPGDVSPTIAFDEHGVCSACRYAEMKENVIDWEARDQEMRDLASQVRSKCGNYDVVVPGSGGKDSMYTSWLLKERYGLTPLLVTWAPHIYTDVGWRNLQRWYSDNTGVLVTPNRRVHRMLTRFAFMNTVFPFSPFVCGQRIIGPRYSALYRIPLVMYGENPAEYGNNIAENFNPRMDPRFYTGEAGVDASTSVVLGGVSGEELMREHGLSRQDLEPYLPVDRSALFTAATECHYMGYYVKWHQQSSYYEANKAYGFEANDQRTEGSYSKYSSIDDKLDVLHYLCGYILFALGRASYDAAQEIRTGVIDRDEGVALVKQYDHEIPRRYLAECLEYMGITEAAFWERLDRARPEHLWRKNDDGTYALKHAVYEANS